MNAIQIAPSIFYGGNRSKKNEFKKTLETLTPEQKKLKGNVLHYFKSCRNDFLTLEQRALIKALNNDKLINEISITKLNCFHYLHHLKIIDLALSEYNKAHITKINLSSYKLRTQILKQGFPFVTTTEAYTKTLDPVKMKDYLYLQNPSNWVPERTGLHMKIMANQLVLTMALSKRLNHEKSTLWAIRGNSAVGKTYAAANDDFFHSALNEEEKLLGDLNVDNFKYNLKVLSPIDKKPFLINSQVHLEGGALFESYRIGLQRDAKRGSFLYQARFSTIEEVENYILKPGLSNGQEISILDIQASLECSLNRILVRDPYDKDPCPPLEGVVEGFINCIKYRNRLIELIKENYKNIVKQYRLYLIDSTGLRHLVAEKIEGVFKIYSQNQFRACCIVPANQEIERQLDCVITPEFIDQAIQNRHVAPSSRYLLQKWIGLKVKEAVKLHVLALSPPIHAKWCYSIIKIIQGIARMCFKLISGVFSKLRSYSSL